MKLTTLLGELKARGHWLEVQGSKVRCHGPAPASPEIAAAIRQHRAALVQRLVETSQSAPESGRSPTNKADRYVAGGLDGGKAKPEAQAWIEIDGTSFSPAAADLYRRSVPFSADAASERCRSCSGTRWWRLHDGCPWICARCHPTDRAEHEVEWREGESRQGRPGGLTLPLAPTGSPKTIPAPSECPACGSLLSWLRAGESAWRCRQCDPLPDGETPALLGRLEDAP